MFEPNINTDLIEALLRELDEDIRLIERMSKDDKKSFQTIYEAYFKPMYFYGYKILRDDVIVEEIVQEVFIYLWNKRKQLKISSSLKSYLYTAVRNRCINYIKYELPKRRIAEDNELEKLVIDEEKSDESRNEYLRINIQKAVNQLPPKCRTIFLLSREEGLTYQEIAEELDISAKTVENQIIIALKKLRVSLKDLWDFF